MTRRIAVVTGSRADFGLLRPVIDELGASAAFDVRLWATGMHLSAAFGRTVDEIRALGLNVEREINCLVDGDSPSSVTRSVGRAVTAWADVLGADRPDAILVLGDRFEILAVVQAALFFQVPVVHLCGGDVTEGAFDEAIRHSISKMSHLHFVTNSAAARRLRQLGENPAHVFDVGSPAIDLIARTDFVPFETLAGELAIRPDLPLFLVTFHPVTLSGAGIDEEMRRQVGALLVALSAHVDKTSIVFTRSNADTAHRAVTEPVDAFCMQHANAHVFTSLGTTRYWSLMRVARAVIGNSSSGLYEAPTFRVPTVNIGDRQRGRLKAASVVDCPPDAGAVAAAVDAALALDCSNVVNPYGQGGTAAAIRRHLEAVPDFQMLVRKRFFDLA